MLKTYKEKQELTTTFEYLFKEYKNELFKPEVKGEVINFNRLHRLRLELTAILKKGEK